MRILEFTVRKQRLLKKPSCDFTGLVAGSKGYLHAKFEFPYDDWNNYEFKIASFWIGDKESAVQLDDNNTCNIPHEILTGAEFRVYLIGANRSSKIETNEVRVQQEVKTNGKIN